VIIKIYIIKDLLFSLLIFILFLFCSFLSIKFLAEYNGSRILIDKSYNKDEIELFSIFDTDKVFTVSPYNCFFRDGSIQDTLFSSKTATIKFEDEEKSFLNILPTRKITQITKYKTNTLINKIYYTDRNKLNIEYELDSNIRYDLFCGINLFNTEMYTIIKELNSIELTNGKCSYIVTNSVGNLEQIDSKYSLIIFKFDNNKIKVEIDVVCN